MNSMIILGVVLAAIVFVVSIYNNLISLRNRFKNAFSQIDVQLKRRYDLIPNLVETAKGYMKHEKETLEAVIQARNQAVAANQKAAAAPENAASIQALAQAESTLGATLGRLFALSESYPDLKANENMQRLMEELTSTENRIGFARQSFNDAVMNYNTACEQFPGVVVAGFFNFKKAEHFEVERALEREPVQVSFS